MDNATIKYSTVQNWYAGDKEGKGGIYNFVTKRGNCLGKIRSFHGPKLRQVQQLLGNILVVI